MDDLALLTAIATGNDQALRELFDRHAPWVAQRLRSSLPPDAVEDVLQETFVAVWRGSGRFNGQGEPAAWIWGSPVTVRRSRLTILFFRSRATEQPLIILTMVAVAATITFAITDNPELMPILFMVILLAASVVVGAAIGSPFGEAERTASQPLPTLRGVHLALLLVCGGIGLAISSVAQADDPLGTLLRNGAGFAGLALLGARLFGSGSSWLLPLGYGGVAFVDYLIRPDLDADWRWPLQSASDTSALALALTLFAFGISAIVIAGSRESPGETA